jgi:hypothetical protein
VCERDRETQRERDREREREGMASCKCVSAAAVQGRRFFVGGNWKLNGSKASIKALLEAWDKQDVDKAVGR